MTARTPRKSPAQSRSRATVAAILEAAARILEEGGPARLTTNRVAERAGVSVGSLYQYFPNREAILAELVREMRQEMLDDLTAAIATAPDDLTDAVPLLVRASLAHHARRPELAARLEEMERDLVDDAETQALKRAVSALVVGELTRHAVPDAPTAALDLSAIAKGIAEAATAAGERDYEAIAVRITRAVLGYLRTAASQSLSTASIAAVSNLSSSSQ